MQYVQPDQALEQVLMLHFRHEVRFRVAVAVLTSYLHADILPHHASILVFEDVAVIHKGAL